MNKKKVVSLQDDLVLSKMEENKIVIYQTEDEQTQIDVRLENDTVWLTQTQMVKLFKSSRTNILEHIQHIYEDDELDKLATCRKFRQVQKEGNRMVNRTKIMYNLDMIISVGYRVNTKRGIKFRQWANRVLKQYLIKGYAINERIRKEQIGELRQLVQVVGRTISNQELPNTSESQDLLDVVVDYTYALDTLDNYDYERLSIDRNKNNDNNKILIRCAPKRRTFLLSLHRELKKVRRWKIKRQGHQRKSIC